MMAWLVDDYLRRGIACRLKNLGELPLRRGDDDIRWVPWSGLIYDKKDRYMPTWA
jgi:hypothetical protein